MRRDKDAGSFFFKPKFAFKCNSNTSSRQGVFKSVFFNSLLPLAIISNHLKKTYIYEMKKNNWLVIRRQDVTLGETPAVGCFLLLCCYGVITVLDESPLVWTQNLQRVQSEAETTHSTDGSESETNLKRVTRRLSENTTPDLPAKHSGALTTVSSRRRRVKCF